MGNPATFIRNTSLKFLQILYSQRPPNHYHFDTDERNTEIIICDQNAQLAAEELRPRIQTVRGPLRWQNVGHVSSGMVNLNMATGERQSTDILLGSLGIGVFSRNPIEAEAIASDVFNSFKAFKDLLQKHGFYSIRSSTLGSQSIVEQQGYAKLTMVPVTIVCQVQREWALEKEVNTKLRKIIVSTLIKEPEPSEEIASHTIEGES